MSGPAPKKDAERRRRNTTPEASGSLSAIPAEVINLDDLALSGEVEIPAADEKWHPIAKQVYQAQRDSGQVLFMEPSDWAMLYLLCESISRDLNPQFVGLTEAGEPVHEIIPLKGASLNAYLKGFNDLLVAEGGRRKLRLELERKNRLDAAAGAVETGEAIVLRREDAFKGA